MPQMNIPQHQNLPVGMPQTNTTTRLQNPPPQPGHIRRPIPTQRVATPAQDMTQSTFHRNLPVGMPNIPQRQNLPVGMTQSTFHRNPPNLQFPPINGNGLSEIENDLYASIDDTTSSITKYGTLRELI